MLVKVQFCIDVLGSYLGAAKYLGYTERHFYNIRKRLERGEKLHRRVELHILRMTDQLQREQKRHQTKGH